jgi:hypothetical protein
MLEAMARIAPSQPNEAMARIASRRNGTISLDPSCSTPINETTAQIEHCKWIFDHSFYPIKALRSPQDCAISALNSRFDLIQRLPVTSTKI